MSKRGSHAQWSLSVLAPLFVSACADLPAGGPSGEEASDEAKVTISVKQLSGPNGLPLSPGEHVDSNGRTWRVRQVTTFSADHEEMMPNRASTLQLEKMSAEELAELMRPIGVDVGVDGVMWERESS